MGGISDIMIVEKLKTAWKCLQAKEQFRTSMQKNLQRHTPISSNDPTVEWCWSVSLSNIHFIQTPVLKDKNEPPLYTTLYSLLCWIHAIY